MENIKKYPGLLLIMAIVIVIAGVYFFWLPKYGEYDSSFKILKSKEGELERKSVYLAEIEAKLNALTDYEDEISKINTAIPIYDFSEVSLLSFIQKVGSENGIVLTDMEIALRKDENPIASISGNGSWKMRELVLNAAVSGSYDSFKSLLKAIYLNSRMIEVNSISFKSKDENKYDFDLELSANYYLWEMAAANSPSGDVSAEI